jgi:hypothetical protein
MSAAEPLRPKDCDPFLRTLAAELEKHRDIEPGFIHRLGSRNAAPVFSIRRSSMVHRNTIERSRQKVPTEKNKSVKRYDVDALVPCATLTAR